MDFDNVAATARASFGLYNTREEAETLATAHPARAADFRLMLDELRDLYQELILDHGKHPRNFGHRTMPTGTLRGDNPMCGDKVTVFLKVNDDGIVGIALFEGRGCAISTASASMMTQLIVGRSQEQGEALFEESSPDVTRMTTTR